MKAITICQPYASLICLPETDPRHKRVENRTWACPLRDRRIAIHAGKSRKFLKLTADKRADAEYRLAVADMPFGAIVAVATIAETVALNTVKLMTRGLVINGQPIPDVDMQRSTVPEWAQKRFPWLDRHPHVEGPYCWVLEDVRVLDVPIPCSGAQGLWSIPGDIVQQLKGL